MANHAATKKDVRQSTKRNERNRYYGKTTRNAIRDLKASEKAAATAAFPKVAAMIDKLAKRGTIHKNKAANLKSKLAPFGFEVVENQKSVLVQKIKDAIIELVYMDDNNNFKSSVFLAEKLNHSYGYLSNVFSEVTYSSIENFIILQKIERAKQLMLVNEMSLTEIAFLLNYSSVAHLSTQFKNTTGITPSTFQRIIKKRRENLK